MSSLIFPCLHSWLLVLLVLNFGISHFLYCPQLPVLWVEMSHSLCSQQESCFLRSVLKSPFLQHQFHLLWTVIRLWRLCSPLLSCVWRQNRVVVCGCVCEFVFFFGSVFWSCVFMGAYLHLLHFLHTPVLHTTPLYLCVSVMYKSIRYMWLCVCVWLCQYCIQSVYICQYLNLVWLRQLKPWNSILGGCQMQNASRTLQPRVWLCILYFCCSRLFIFF